MRAAEPARGRNSAAPRQRLCILLAMLTVASVAQARGAPAGRKLEEARTLFRAERYEEACPRFEEVTRARPTDGAAWADLGLCELRRGRREASIRASLRAVREGDERVRSSAYYNLWVVGERLAVPTQTPSCMDVEAPAELACTRRARLCTYAVEDGGNGGGKHYTGVWLTDAAAPLAPPDSDEDGSRPDRVAVLLSASLWISSKRCDFNGAFRPPVFDRVLARCQAASPRGEHCVLRVRGALMEAVLPGTSIPGQQLFPLTDAEKQQARVASRQCLRELAVEERENSGNYCHLLVVDPCRRRVGVACDVRARRRLDWRFQQEPPTSPQEQIRVEEHSWQPSEQLTP